MELIANKSYTVFGDIDGSTENDIKFRKTFNETQDMKNIVDDNNKSIEFNNNVDNLENQFIQERINELDELNELNNKIPRYEDIYSKDISIEYRQFIEILIEIA